MDVVKNVKIFIYFLKQLEIFFEMKCAVKNSCISFKFLFFSFNLFQTIFDFLFSLVIGNNTLPQSLHFAVTRL